MAVPARSCAICFAFKDRPNCVEAAPAPWPVPEGAVHLGGAEGAMLVRHGSHLAFKQDDNLPLSNLFVTVLRRLGIDADAFGSSTGPLSGLEA